LTTFGWFTARQEHEFGFKITRDFGWCSCSWSVMQGIMKSVQGKGTTSANHSVLTAIEELSNLRLGFMFWLVTICLEQHLCSSDDSRVVFVSARVVEELSAFFGGQANWEVLAHTEVCHKIMKFR
jgi:hypothetical protein